MFIVLRFSHAHLVKKPVCLEQGNSAYQRMRYRPRTKTTFLVTMVAVARVLHYVNQGAISRLGRNEGQRAFTPSPLKPSNRWLSHPIRL